MSLSHFQNAHHFEANHGQFINAVPGANLTINNNVDNTDAVSRILRQYVATGASFDSAERYPPAKCHSGTRKRIINEITNWIDDPNTNQSIVWVYGPAGSGKSALAQSICELLEEDRPERRGASFFFARGVTDRGNALKLFTTISYHLAVRFPSVRAEINNALDHDSTLPTKSMESQLLSLIVQPLLQCKNPPLQSPVVIIDGLDECADDEETNSQRDIIALIAKSIINYKLPLRFFVASRPEYWIRDAFDVSPLPTITRSLSLQNEVHANRDIRNYLVDEFDKIRLKNKRIMGSVPLPWPPTQVIDHLVYEASGQFVYAATVIRFVGRCSRFTNPQEQLRILISPGPHQALAFSELDRLYATIISAYPRWPTMKCVLGGLLIYATPMIVKVLLNVDQDELVLVMDALSSLVSISEARFKDPMLDGLLKFASSGGTRQDSVTFYHLSFLEFLQDETRSGPFYIDVDGFRDEITRAFFGMLHLSLDQYHGFDRYLIWNVDFATYRWILYAVAIFLCDSKAETLRPLIIDMTERLKIIAESEFRGSMKSLVWFTEDMIVLESAIQANLGTSERKENSKQTANLLTLWERFRDAVVFAQKRGMNALALRGELKVTPILVYLAEFSRSTEWISFDQLAIMIGTTDLISAIKQHRHVIHLSYFYPTRQWHLKLVDMKVWFQGATNSHIQDSDDWKDVRVLLLHYMLKSVFKDNWTSVDVMNYDDGRYLMLKESFFDSKSMIDICSGMRYQVRNTCKCLSLLRFIGNLHLGQIVKFWPWGRFYQHVPSLIISIICWLNRQLLTEIPAAQTNPQNITLVHDHDETLPQNMTKTMKYLFEIFLKNFLVSYTRQLYAREYSPHLQPHRYLRLKVIAIKVFPLPQGLYSEDIQIDPASVHEGWISQPLYWPAFHDEVFGKMDESQRSSTLSIIDASRWHPHLASCLLNALAKYLYGQVYPMFSISNSWNNQQKLNFQESLSYITQCLPFAWPTLENLEALRLLVYLYPRVIEVCSIASLLPEGIWLSIAAFLQKYPRSVLSSEELNLFESWLYNPEHPDISRYVSQ